MTDKKNKLLSKPIIVCLTAGICSLLWGSAFPFIKIGYELFSVSSYDTASQILFAGIRFILAGILSVIFGSIARKKVLLPKKNDIVPVIGLSFFQTTLQYIFFYIGLANTAGVKASVIEGANVFVAILISSLIFKSEKLTGRKVIGSVIGFAGIIIVNINGLDFSSSMKLTGEGFIFLSTVAYAFSSALMKNFSRKHDPILLSGYQFIFGGIIMTVAGLIFNGSVKANGAKSVIILLWLAFVSAAAYSLWSTLLKYNDVSNVAVYGFMNPMFGVILSAVLLNEKNEAFGVKGLFALLLVCAGIFIVNSGKRKFESVSTQ